LEELNGLVAHNSKEDLVALVSTKPLPPHALVTFLDQASSLVLLDHIALAAPVHSYHSEDK